MNEHDFDPHYIEFWNIVYANWSHKEVTALYHEAYAMSDSNDDGA